MQIGPEDQELYTDFFRQEPVSELYANNWAYIIQACRGSGGLGHKYFDGTTLVSIGKHDGHYVLVRPLGANPVAAVQMLAKRLHKISKKPVYAKHVLPEQAADFKCIGFSDMRQYPWSAASPLDDDTFPQVVVALDNIFRVEQKESRELRLRLNRFLNYAAENLTLQEACFLFAPELYNPEKHLYQKTHAVRVLEKWASKNKELMDAYTNMIEYPPSEGFCYIMRIGIKARGFYVFGKIGERTVGCHATIADYRQMPGLSEAALMKCFGSLHNKGIRRVNLGGSETEALYKFKLKFRPHELKEATHMVYLP